jgi:hypothetical protein
MVYFAGISPLTILIDCLVVVGGNHSRSRRYEQLELTIFNLEKEDVQLDKVETKFFIALVSTC